MDNIDDLEYTLRKFRDDRDWKQFHRPKDLILALTGEVGELAKVVQWKTDEQILDIRYDEIAPEMADIFIYLINLALVLDIDLVSAANIKIENNEKRYPVELCKGTAKKASEL